MRTIEIDKLPDFILIKMANESKDEFLNMLIDAELEARYESFREDLEPCINELPF